MKMTRVSSAALLDVVCQKLVRRSDIRELIHIVAIGIGFAFDHADKQVRPLASGEASQSRCEALASVRDQLG